MEVLVRWMLVPLGLVMGVGCELSVGGKDTSGGDPSETTPLDTGAPAPTEDEFPDIPGGETIAVWEGDLREGDPIDLEWAESAAVACFPSNLFKYFTGSHVFYEVDLPEYSGMYIDVLPTPGLDVSLYAYSRSTTDPVQFPPDVTSVVACEASPDGAPFNGPGVDEQVYFNAIEDPFHIVIAVAGSGGAMAGAFTVRVTRVDL